MVTKLSIICSFQSQKKHANRSGYREMMDSFSFLPFPFEKYVCFLFRTGNLKRPLFSLTIVWEMFFFFLNKMLGVIKTVQFQLWKFLGLKNVVMILLRVSAYMWTFYLLTKENVEGEKLCSLGSKICKWSCWWPRAWVKGRGPVEFRSFTYQWVDTIHRRKANKGNRFIVFRFVCLFVCFSMIGRVYGSIFLIAAHTLHTELL